MNSRAGLTVGHIPYLNCFPVFHYLRDSGFRGELVSGVPSALNWMLQLGELDVSPSSSFEYARNWQDYLLLPGHSISSLGKIQSVLFFSPVELSELEGEQVAITGESATSINLLRVILREFYGLSRVTDFVPEEPVEMLIAKQRPALLIGDRALRLAGNLPEGMRIFDLGEIWSQQTGLPFVFALWMIRRTALKEFAQELAELPGQLRQSLKLVLSNPQRSAEQAARSSVLSPEKIIDYWRNIDYRLNAEHLEGLQLFFRLCTKYGLLEEEPPLEFFQGEIL